MTGTSAGRQKAPCNGRPPGDIPCHTSAGHPAPGGPGRHAARASPQSGAGQAWGSPGRRRAGHRSGICHARAASGRAAWGRPWGWISAVRLRTARQSDADLLRASQGRTSRRCWLDVQSRSAGAASQRLRWTAWA